jgi:beta-glucosidase
MPNRLELKFPKNFLWGVATSAHQIEGGQHNQWSVWELENAKALAAQSSYQFDDLSNWPEVKRSAQTPSNYVSGRATEHYARFAEDISLVRKLNLNAFRFSIEWSRVQPEQGAWDAGAVKHYKEVLAELKKQGIEPMVTLFHFTLPVWFTEMGGFEKRANVKFFVEFAERILSELGGTIRYVITINEPEIYASQSYLEAKWPPQVQNRAQYRRVLANLAFAHNTIAKKLHAASRRYRVSVAKNSAYIYPGDDSALSVRAAAVMQYQRDDMFLRKVIKQCDFLGVNYYFSERVYGYRVHNPDERLNDLGWDMQPQYLERALERLSEKYKKPIIVTENGLADASDEDRQWWLMQTILAMQRAMRNGVELLGYFHWSLTDNFEWDKGYWPRFGLYAVDYRTMERTPRPSAVWFAKVLKKVRGL